MIAQQVAKKYAGALFRLASERNMMDLAWKQFNDLAEYLEKDDTFLDFMAAPQVPDQNKERMITQAFAGLFEKPFFNFMMVLVRKRRITYLIEIIEEYDRLVRAEKGIAKATCITTTGLSDSERGKVIEKLATKTSLKIELEEKVDKSIIGGMIIIFHNQIIDGSIRYGLRRLKNKLMQVKVH
jgi:F-type H+-transporting ATPase subunit delta